MYSDHHSWRKQMYEEFEMRLLVSDFISLHIMAVGDWTKRLRAMGQIWDRRSSAVSDATTISSTHYNSSHDNVAFVDEMATTSGILSIDHQSLTFGESRKLALPVTQKNPVTLLTAKPKPVSDIYKIEENLPDSRRSSFEDVPRKVTVLALFQHVFILDVNHSLRMARLSLPPCVQCQSKCS